MAGPNTNARDESAGLRRNALLASLPEEELALLAPQARVHAMRRGDVLFHAGHDVDAAFFPCDALVSMLVVTPDGRTAEVATIGPEGALGGLVATSAHVAFARAVVQMPGDVVTVGLQAIEDLKARSAAMGDALSRFADCLIAQLLQSNACNVRHGLEQRLARWLLAMRDHMGTDSLALTQEYLAELLGVQRTSVTATALRLQQGGLIRYARGRIALLDVEALEGVSCRCQLQVRRHYDRMIPGGYARGTTI